MFDSDGVNELETSIRLKMNGLGRNFMFIGNDIRKEGLVGGTIQPTTTNYLLLFLFI